MMDRQAALGALGTPALLLDEARMRRNIERLQTHLEERNVSFRPHMKTAKCIEVLRALVRRGGLPPITVSTLAEAEAFAKVGAMDIIYAVGITPEKISRALALRRQGCDLKVIIESVQQAQALEACYRETGEVLPALIEIDCDGSRAGVPPGVDVQRVGKILATVDGMLAGVLTPLMAEGFDDVTEVRAGVFMFFDRVMAKLKVCTLDVIALSVLTSVTGHRRDKGWAIVDAGWSALSSDPGPSGRSGDGDYGLVCDIDGRIIDGLFVSRLNQEHGIIMHRGRNGGCMPDLPVGTRLRIIPNHACATAGQFDCYHVVHPHADGLSRWPRFRGW